MPTGFYKHYAYQAFKKGNKLGKYNLGKKHSEEHKRKISLAHKGKKGIYKHSEETKKKISDSNKGRKLSEEWKNKISESCKGEKSSNWKGGITPENQKIKNSIEYRLWREAVFARDNWTCQKYKIRGGSLHAHHIRNFAEEKDLRFAINNGITFCRDCHKKFHKKYGKRNNTKEQLIEFLKI